MLPNSEASGYRQAPQPLQMQVQRQVPTYSMVTAQGVPANFHPTPVSPSSQAPSEGQEDVRSNEFIYCGVDLKPFLPPALAISIIAGALCTLAMQVPTLCQMTCLPQGPLIGGVIALNGVTLVLMGYCKFADPGQTKKTRSVTSPDLEEGQKPKRAHMSFQYARPIRRYDHWCKWLNNVIGLLNHREFFLMLVGLSLIGVLGVAMDGYVAILLVQKGLLEAEIFVALHLAFSLALLAIEVPMLKIHCGLVSRNELAQEWKQAIHYVAHNSKGERVPVEDLDDEEHNDLFDQGLFEYDPERNMWDKGCPTNCFNFWCWPRWRSAEKGEF